MSRIKELKNNINNSINLVTFIESILPEDINEPKYVETLLRILKSDRTHSSFYSDWTSVKKKYGFNDTTDELTLYMKYFFYVLALTLEEETKDDFIEFCRDNERNLIEQNDLSRYNTFKDIKDEVKKSRSKKEESILLTQVHNIHEDDEWLIIRPLTFLSSRKYGSNTKWCTTEKNTPSYFLTRRDNGLLIYCINKKTNNKVAFEQKKATITDKSELSVWSSTSEKIDSFECGLPINILTIVYRELNSPEFKTNKSFMDKEMIKSEEKYLSSLNKQGREDDLPF
jgi:hypothetical protein